MDILDYGVCRLSVVPVRKEPNHRAEQTSQLLFGDHYEVVGRTTDKIEVKQHQSISKEYFDHINNAEFKITTDVTSSLLYNKNQLMILMGSVIPISSTELFNMNEQFAFNGETKSLGQKREFEFLKAIASKYLNAPYLWGGKTPFGIDCSGLTQIVFKICGYRLFRDAYQQAQQGKSIRSLSESRPGDLAFFHNAEGKIIHTGIVLGADKIIHASGKVRIDQLHEQGIFNVETQGYTHQLSHLRRIMQD
jgi:gamma-D-glutamyl-L-lysine dipeptidyl-peptidase